MAPRTRGGEDVEPTPVYKKVYKSNTRFLNLDDKGNLIADLGPGVMGVFRGGRGMSANRRGRKPGALMRPKPRGI